MTVLLRRREGPIEILTLNRPEQRNALNPELIEALSEALAQSEVNPQVRVLVLTATGTNAFCAGMDLKAFSEGAILEQGRSTACFETFLQGRFSKPVIAAVNGTAVGGGFELMLACDMAVMANNAKLGLPEVKHGLFPAGTGVLLPARIPLPIALEMGLTGGLLDAPRALQLGLVNRVEALANVLPAALDFAQSVADNSPLGVAATKRLMCLCEKEGAAAALAALPAQVAAVFSSQDAREGAAAFAQKRSPVWRNQ
ncbi:enoyl-CoA hydratase [Pseudomonas capeferrum]|uniref:enoyl-CoA hydratase-related protein n=1 Tax=Pseudomonas capeferrum TaxID=1495066 RepID=UPI0015E401E6|nr:enoyl-CoA hydratase-related protein [Pseudomonas capeferrum]MBA1204233.1 enoyl-CoA hydratase [Pseudomonas capeferrum]